MALMMELLFFSGEIVEWKDFYDLIRPINIALGHLLFIVMAMCSSIAMISNINIEERAPYRAFICTTREMYPDELYEGFLSFMRSSVIYWMSSGL